ncbi:hypothetical protein [Synechococcus sp. BA-132 BA5]|uniref:hypothetical protein n=1 Tax=Synechococcus sp. BA-132 BA5 TaxID=3110252 RepID=UPI002B21DD9B|nr:hypothetical protein [Synechococcus sp. BA-132 BA5]
MVAPPPPAPPRPAPAEAASGAVPAGLTPLPTSQQVVGSFRVGRKDPFGSLVPEMVPGTAPSAGGTGTAAAAGGRRAAAALPPPAFLQQLQITGVIQSGGHSEVTATFNGESGSLRPGDRGGGEMKLLPPGWRVVAVDIPSGRLILQSGNRKVSKPLPPL